MRKHWAWLALAALISLHACREAQKAPFGLPYTHEWDEPQVLFAPLSMLNEGSLRSVLVQYPNVTGIALLPLVWAHLQDAIRKGHVRGIADYRVLHGPWDFRPVSLLFYARLYWVLFGAATLVLVFVAGRALAGPSAGLLAAALYSVFPIASEIGRVVHPNALMGAASLVAVLAALRCLERPTLSRAAFAGAAAAIAVQTKYNLWPALLPGLVAIAFAFRARKESLQFPERAPAWSHSRKKSLRDTGIACAVFALAFAATFFAINPFFVSDPKYIESLLFNAREYSGFAGPRLGPALLSEIVSQFPGLLPLSILALAGYASVGATDFERRRKLSLLLAFALPFFAFMAMQRHPNARRSFAAISPFLAVLAASGGIWAIEGLLVRVRGLHRLPGLLGRAGSASRPLQRWVSPAALARIPPGSAPALFALALLPVLAPRWAAKLAEIRRGEVFLKYSSFEQGYLADGVNLDDARKTVAHWIWLNVEPGSTIAVARLLHFYADPLHARYRWLEFDSATPDELRARGAVYALIGDFTGSPTREWRARFPVLAQAPGFPRNAASDGETPSQDLATFLLKL